MTMKKPVNSPLMIEETVFVTIIGSPCDKEAETISAGPPGLG